MNKLLSTLCMVLIPMSLTLSAKELPSMTEMMDNLNSSGMTNSDDWEKLGDGFKQNIDTGTVFVAPDSLSSMMVVRGDGEEAILNSFSYANIHCASSSLVAIDMMQNTNLLNSMMESFTGALKAYDNKNNTLVWGYKYETKLVKANDGLIATCSLLP